MKQTSLKKGDTVQVMSGAESGKTGTIERVLRREGRLIVGGINVVKKHLKRSQVSARTGITDKTMPIQSSNVQIVCQSCKKPSRFGFRTEGNQKVRVCRRCGNPVR